MLVYREEPWQVDDIGEFWMAYNAELSHVFGAKSEIMFTEAMEDSCENDSQSTNVIVSQGEARELRPQIQRLTVSDSYCAGSRHRSIQDNK